MQKKPTKAAAFIRESFTNQRNSDQLFSGDIGSHFKNRYQSNICFIEGDDPAPTGDPAPSGDPAPAGGTDYAKMFADPAFAAALKTAGFSRADDDDKDKTSITDERKKQKQREDEEKSNRTQLIKDATAAATFDNLFDSFIDKNARFFPENTATIRKSIDGQNIEDSTERSSLMAATAAKEFFSIKENLNILDSRDRAYVEAQITGKRYENEIKGLEAWAYVEKALYNHGLAGKRGGGGKGGENPNGTNTTGYKALDKHNAKFYPEHIKDLSDLY